MRSSTGYPQISHCRWHLATDTGVITGLDSCREMLEQFKLKFVPLMFGAAWKILDQVIGIAIRRLSTGPQRPASRATTGTKSSAASALTVM
jgi:hypothetical protein